MKYGPIYGPIFQFGQIFKVNKEMQHKISDLGAKRSDLWSDFNKNGFIFLTKLGNVLVRYPIFGFV